MIIKRLLPIPFLLVSMSQVVSAITIDTFETAQSVSANGNVMSNANAVASAHAIGGTRAMQVEVSQAPSQIDEMNLRTLPNGSASVLSHSQDSGVYGISWITWDGDLVTTGVNGSGLGEVDFTKDDATSMILRVKSYDYPNSQPITISMIIYDTQSPTGNRYSVLSKTLNTAISNPSGYTEIEYPFAEFVQGQFSLSPARLTHIGAVQLVINGTNTPDADLRLGFLGTNGRCDHVPVNGLIVDDCDVCNGTNADKGCDGVCFSGKVIDDCGICDGGNAAKGCDGICFSGKVEDQCGVCGGDNTQCMGCDGVPNSGKQLDRCNVCDGNNECVDCAGVPWGSSKLDRCFVCDGNGKSCQTCSAQNMFDVSQKLDGGAKNQEAAIKTALNALKKVNKSKKTMKYIAQVTQEAHRLQLENWIASWTEIYGLTEQCSPTQSGFSECPFVSYTGFKDRYTARSVRLNELGYQVSRYMLKVSKKKLSKAASHLVKRSQALHASNMQILLQVPAGHSAC
ncbi:hypothetical protein JNK13_09395 [bacterium]|nr:hypothetical protein [bacterium]